MAKKEALKRLEDSVLAEGEATGHAHRLSGAVAVYEAPEKFRTFSLKEPDTVTHEEHGPVTLPAGDFCADRAVEYDHAAEEARRVAD